MPKNEDGEFELVVGNKQLLSIVFILMVLFGVVFSMGYWVGRSNTGGDQAQAGAGQTAQGGRPDAAGAPAQRGADSSLQPGEAKVATPDAGTGTGSTSTTPVSTAPAETAPPPQQTAAAEPPPQQQAAAPAPTVAAPPKEREKPKPVAAPPVRPPEPKPQAEAPAPAERAAAGRPAAGSTFLQVAAVKKPQAQMLVDLLRQKGFHAVVDQVEGKDVYRTLVGPVKDAADLARIKAGLESAGFKPFVKKY
jgi:outer membrane biosynthesis protein TonB